jgi:hypothetical protein
MDAPWYIMRLYEQLGGNRAELAYCLAELDKPGLMQTPDWRQKLSAAERDELVRSYDGLISAAIKEAREGKADDVVRVADFQKSCDEFMAESKRIYDETYARTYRTGTERKN